MTARSLATSLRTSHEASSCDCPWELFDESFSCRTGACTFWSLLWEGERSMENRRRRRHRLDDFTKLRMRKARDVKVLVADAVFIGVVRGQSCSFSCLR